MSDNKYGRIFTEDDVREMINSAVFVGIEVAEESDDPQHFNGDAVFDAVSTGFTTRFPEDEPVFVLRARDKRALAALRYYRDHQSQNAPTNHLDGIEKAYKDFDDFATNHRELMKEPD
jgi:hypothetical protein